MKSLHRIVGTWLATSDILNEPENKWLLRTLVNDSLTHEITHKKVAV